MFIWAVRAGYPTNVVLGLYASEEGALARIAKIKAAQLVDDDDEQSEGKVFDYAVTRHEVKR